MCSTSPERDRPVLAGRASALTPAAVRQWPPHAHCGRHVEDIYRTFLLACLPPVAAGTLLFGTRTLLLCSLAVGAALLGNALCTAAAPQTSAELPRSTRRCQACVVGLLLALTLPVTAGWAVPVLGALAGVLISHALLGGLGNHLWHPALIGRAVAELAFSAQIAPPNWSFLGRDRLLTGSIARGTQAIDYFGFDVTALPPGTDAWLAARPIDTLLGWLHSAGSAGSSATGLLELLRDELPPWGDTLWGHTGGGLGETCAPAILLGGLVLLWRGAIRWHLPVAAVLTAGILAAVLPVPAGAFEASATNTRWLPILGWSQGYPTGVAIVLFHLTGGGLLFGCLLVATDPTSTPLTSRGQMAFGVAVGLLTMLARCNPFFVVPVGAVYWAILGANTLVPLFDRLTRRRVLGSRRGCAR